MLSGGWIVSRGDLVTEVIDGDSFKIANKQTIRLASLDAPENGLCYSQESKEALTKLILGKRVLLKDEKTDRYGRPQTASSCTSYSADCSPFVMRGLKTGQNYPTADSHTALSFRDYDIYFGNQQAGTNL